MRARFPMVPFALTTFLLALALSPVTALGQSAQWGEITYPLFGNIRAEQGTILLRFRIDEPMDGDIGDWYQPNKSFLHFSLARFEINPDNSLWIFRRKNTAKGEMWTSMNLEAFPPGSPNLNSGGGDWNEGEAHHVAYTWDENGTHRWWVDGGLMKTMESVAVSRGIGSPTPSGGLLTLGSTDSKNSSAVTLLGIHLLDRPLGESDFRQAEEVLFRPGPDTLLLDLFSGPSFVPDGERQTRAWVITGFNGERGGTPTEACQFVETPYGPGLRLYTPPPGKGPEQDR